MLSFLIKNKNFLNIFNIFWFVFSVAITIIDSYVNKYTTLVGLLILAYPVFLYFLQNYILHKMGMHFSAISASPRGSLENRYGIFFLLPYFGMFIVGYRVNYLLNELEQKIKSGEVKL